MMKRALIGIVSLGISAVTVGVETANAQVYSPYSPRRTYASPRQIAAFRIRQAAALAHLDEQEPLHRSNGDEARYSDKRASFAKTLPHNDFGEVDPGAFATFVSILSSGDSNGFEAIPRDRRAEMDLNDPQATYAFDLAGLDSAATSLDPPPAFPARAWPRRWQRSTGWR
jgi:hypothetical protein